MKVAQALQTLAVDRGREDIRFQLLSIHSSFTEVGPNGTHACLVSPVAGPNLRSTSSLAHGTFRSGLARKACKQVAEALHVTHASGYVHGRKSPCLYSCDDGMPSLRNQIFGKNILFKLSDRFMALADNAIYQALGTPYVEHLDRCDRRQPDAHAPRGVTASIDPTKFAQAGVLQEHIVLADFGSYFLARTEPRNYRALTTIEYHAAEVLMKAKVTQARPLDIWSLGCLIFQVRAGWCLFECYPVRDEVLKRMVRMLGRLPEPWWSSWANRSQYFDETGVSHRRPQWTSIRSALEDVGTEEDHRQAGSALSLFERSGVRIPEEELVLLNDLLCKMLRYRPEERITIDEVIRHPWFAFK
jgi:serine/threonine-protein kinase SRPK3